MPRAFQVLKVISAFVLNGFIAEGYAQVGYPPTCICGEDITPWFRTHAEARRGVQQIEQYLGGICDEPFG